MLVYVLVQYNKVAMVENNVDEIMKLFYHHLLLVSMLDNLLKIDMLDKHQLQMVVIDYHSIIKLIHVYFVVMVQNVLLYQYEFQMLE
jgi:hypothetical protein